MTTEGWQMASADICLEYLEAEGYRPTVGDKDLVEPNETLIQFKIEGGNYCIITDENDPEYFRLMYPNLWKIDTEEDQLAALRCADTVNRERKAVKVYLTPEGDSVFADIELILARPEDFKVVFLRAYIALNQAIHMFYDLVMAPS
jgi:hypothetical protein